MTRPDLSRLATTTLYAAIATVASTLAVVLASIQAGDQWPWQEYAFVGCMLLPFWLCYFYAARERENYVPVKHAGHYASETRFITSANGRIGFLLETVDEGEWKRICLRLLDNKMKFTATVVQHRGFGRVRFEALRRELIDRELAHWVNPRASNSPARLSPTGYNFVCKYARIERKANKQIRQIR